MKQGIWHVYFDMDVQSRASECCSGPRHAAVEPDLSWRVFVLGPMCVSANNGGGYYDVPRLVFFSFLVLDLDERGDCWAMHVHSQLGEFSYDEGDSMSSE